jgi:hypothetical protein
MKRPIIAALACLLFSTAAAAQGGTHYGACGDVGRWTDEDVQSFFAPSYIEEDYAAWRADLGITAQPASASVGVVRDEKVCRDLKGVVREALRTSTRVRLNDVIPTYMQVGRYYLVQLTPENPTPSGVEARFPGVIIDGSTMSLVRIVMW